MKEYVWIGPEYAFADVNLQQQTMLNICIIQCIAWGHSASQWVLIERWAYSEPCRRSNVEQNKLQSTSSQKSERILKINEVFSMTSFWIFQFCRYAKVLNSQDYAGLTYFRKHYFFSPRGWKTVDGTFMLWTFRCSIFWTYLLTQLSNMYTGILEWYITLLNLLK